MEETLAELKVTQGTNWFYSFSPQQIITISFPLTKLQRLADVQETTKQPK